MRATTVDRDCTCEVTKCDRLEGWLLLSLLLLKPALLRANKPEAESDEDDLFELDSSDSLEED